jgi:hypothetical protein
MKSRIKVYLTAIIFCIMIITQPAFGENGFHNPLMNLNLSPEQMLAMQDVFEEFSAVQLELRGNSDIKMAELKLEMMKKDRFDTKAKEEASRYRVNKLVREISALFGESFKNNVAYLLKAKDVFSEEQRGLVFRNLRNFNFQMPEEIFGVVENELLNLNLGFTYDQVKKILKNRAKRAKKEIDLKLKSSLQVIDLQKEMVQEQRDSDKINKIILKITELGTEQLDNRVVHFLKAKDILTLDQKKKLFHAVLMMPNY